MKFSHIEFYKWILFAGLVSYGIFIVFHSRVIFSFLEQDITHLSSVILAIFLLATVHAGYCSYRLCEKELLLRRAVIQEDNLKSVLGVSEDIGVNDETLMKYLHWKLGCRFQNGWFMVDMVIKIGLIGTVCGFIMMLHSVSSLEGDVDISSLKLVLLQMSTGMKIALHTTLVGISSGLLLAIQYKFLDNHVNKIIAELFEMRSNV